MYNEKTEQETLFIKLISRFIFTKSRSNYEAERKIMEFIAQSEFYYDVFCEAVYGVMTNDGVKTVSLDETGFSRLNLFSPINFDVGFELLTKEDIANPNDDVIVYINLALQRLIQRGIQEERRRA